MVGDKFFGGSTDIWTGRNRKMFISFTIHFVDGPALRSIDLACRPFNKAHTGANSAQELNNIMITTGLDPMKCTAITMDNASNMMKVGEILDAADDNKIVALSCFCHSIQLSIQRFLGLAKVKGSLSTTRATGGVGGVGVGGSGVGSNGGGNGGSNGGDGGSNRNGGDGGSNGGDGGGGGSSGGGGGGGGGGAPAGGGGAGAASNSDAPDTVLVKDTLKLCNDIVKSFTRSPKVTCSCGMPSCMCLAPDDVGVDYSTPGFLAVRNLHLRGDSNLMHLRCWKGFVLGAGYVACIFLLYHFCHVLANSLFTLHGACALPPRLAVEYF